MPRRRQKDYIAVLQAFSDLMLSALGESRLEVVEIVSDFEAALSNAEKAVFPEVHHSGCNFHWAQAIIRKVCFIYLFIRLSILSFHLFAGPESTTDDGVC